MKKEEIEKKVKEILVRILGVDESEVTPEASLQNDLGMDSLDALEIIMDCEKEYQIVIDDSDAETVETVQDIINALVKVLGEQGRLE